VALGDLPLTAEAPEDGVELVAESVEHDAHGHRGFEPDGGKPGNLPEAGAGINAAR
jgi:hypothetical protein